MGRQATPLPEAIGRFRIESLLGRGGMGEVYKAFDPTLQRTVAVKTVRPDIDRPEYLDRMMREAQACARLSHPNIVTVYEAGQVDGVVFIVMEYLQGQNLDQVLDSGNLSFEQKITILAKVLEALHHAHALDVVHRDIKPSNIHLQSDGTIKLMDFGLARMMQADTLTASGNVLGTPHYASPEQLKGESIDRRTDIYSAGVMAYEMLSGRRPFEPDNDSISSVILKVIQQPPAPMDTDLSRMLPEIESIVSRAMAKAPGDRFQSADEMRQALMHFLDNSRARISAIESKVEPIQGSTVLAQTPLAIPAVPLSSHLPAKSKTMLWAGGAAAAALVAAIVMAMPGPGAANREPETGTSPTPVVLAPAGSGATSSRETPANPSSPEPARGGTAPLGTAPIPPLKDDRRQAEARPPQFADAAPAPAPAASVPPMPGVVPPSLDAKEMFSDTTGTAPGLRFRLIQAGANDSPADVDPAKSFATGDRIRFAFESNIDGYLYVAQKGTSGNWTVLFPNPDINGGRNNVKRFAEYEVPEGDWFKFDAPAGTEQLFVFLSREPLKTLPGFDKPVQSYERATPALVAELQGTIASRDLVFAKDRASAGKGPQATYIVNKSELGKAVTASFTLTHK